MFHIYKYKSKELFMLSVTVSLYELSHKSQLILNWTSEGSSRYILYKYIVEESGPKSEQTEVKTFLLIK